MMTSSEALSGAHWLHDYSLAGVCTKTRTNAPETAPAVVQHRVKKQMDAHVDFYRLWLDRVAILARVLQTKTRLEAERIAMTIARPPAHSEYLLRAKMASELPFRLAA
jgi:hypothetical protein